MKTLEVEYYFIDKQHFVYVSTGANPSEHDETLKAFSFIPDGNLNGKSFRDDSGKVVARTYRALKRLLNIADNSAAANLLITQIGKSAEYIK
jgi:hypothetical protein